MSVHLYHFLDDSARNILGNSLIDFAIGSVIIRRNAPTAVVDILIANAAESAKRMQLGIVGNVVYRHDLHFIGQIEVVFEHIANVDAKSLGIAAANDYLRIVDEPRCVAIYNLDVQRVDKPLADFAGTDVEFVVFAVAVGVHCPHIPRMQATITLHHRHLTPNCFAHRTRNDVVASAVALPSKRQIINIFAVLDAVIVIQVKIHHSHYHIKSRHCDCYSADVQQRRHCEYVFQFKEFHSNLLI